MIRLLITALLIALAGSADAQLLNGVSRPSTGGGAVTPPSCTSGLDLSQSCNAVFLNVVIF